MNAKTIFIIVITALITLILVNNSGEMDLWLFGVSKVSTLAVLGSVFGIGFLLGMIVRSPKKKAEVLLDTEEEDDLLRPQERKSNLSDEDKDYIS
jgi:preprotein translocase subunit SecG